jgi:uncharacterized repeat protein (TIGR03806 family)
MASAREYLSAAAAALLLAGCGSNDDDTTDVEPVLPRPAPPGAPWATLSEWSLFRDIEQQLPAETVVPFAVNSVLYADDAEKTRFAWLPEGGKLVYSGSEPWQFPPGSILVKTFWFPNDARDPSLGRRLVETRLLVYEPEGWVGHTYVYADSQSQGVLLPTGRSVAIDWIDADGSERHQQYEVPNVFDCQSCHGTKPNTHPLGPRTRQLERELDYGAGPENQIDHLASLGWFDAAPPADRERLVDPRVEGPIVERARAYLDANCAHCHSDGGKAESTGLWLDYALTDPATGDPSDWGVCKFPTSAGPASGGLDYDIVPGDPDASIMVLRVASAEPAVKMPPLLTRLPDAAGVSVLREWISAMPPENCD